MILTLHATAFNPTSAGYVPGTSYEFIFTVGSFAENSASAFTHDRSLWVENSPTHSQLFLGVGGTGLTGTYTRPNNARLALGGTSASPYLSLVVGTPDGIDTLGVTTLTGKEISALSFVATPLFAFTATDYPNAYTNPVNLFSTHDGADITGTGTTFLMGYLDTPGVQASYGYVYFTVTEGTLNYVPAGAAVPEPSTYVALAGAAALGCAWWRRRGKAGMVQADQG